MAKPNPVLHIVVWAPWVGYPAIQKLRDAGHTITIYGAPGWGETRPAPDIIMHPAAHGWHEALFESITTNDKTRYPYVDTALAAARQRRKAAK